jgi:hypothetical protein
MPLTTTQAQEQENDGIQSDGNISDSDMVLVAEVNIRDAEFIEKNDTGIEMYFLLRNDFDKAQAGIKYGVEIVDEAGIVVDSKVYDESVTLSPGEEKKINVRFQFTPTLTCSNCKAVITTETETGIPLGSHIFNDNPFDVVARMKDGLIIDQNSCKIHVNDEEQSYLTNFGIDVNVDDELFVICDILNESDIEIEFQPQFTTSRNSEFGDVVEVLVGNIESVKPGTKEFKFKIIQRDLPGGYNVNMQLLNKKFDVISNNVKIHYVTQGDGATIKNVQTNQNATFKENDIIDLSIDVAPSADLFEGSRASHDQQDRTVETQKINLKVEITDEKGVCGFMEKENISVNESDVSIKLNKKCENPTIEVIVKDESGKILDKYTVQINNDENKKLANSNSTKSVSNFPISLKIVWIITLICILVIILYKKFTKQTNVLMWLSVVSVSMLFASVDVAHASRTYEIPKGYMVPVDYVVIGLDKDKYCDTGETITVNAEGMRIACHNWNIAQDLIWNKPGSAIDVFKKRCVHVTGDHSWRACRQTKVYKKKKLGGDETKVGSYNATFDAKGYSYKTGFSKSHCMKMHKAYNPKWYAHTSIGDNVCEISSGETEIKIPYKVESCTSCGNGKTEPNNKEECDDGASKNGVACSLPTYANPAGKCTYCNKNCKIITRKGPHCGDGIKNGSEECDGTIGVIPSQGEICKPNCTIGYLAQCGSANTNNVETSTEPTKNLCPLKHTASSVTYDDVNHKWRWTCTHNNILAKPGHIGCSAPVPEARCGKANDPGYKTTVSTNKLTNTKPTTDLCKSQGNSQQCNWPGSGTEEVVMGNDGWWKWTCAHKPQAFPQTRDCHAPSCLANNPITYPNPIILTDNTTAKIGVSCPNPNPNPKLCCKIRNTASGDLPTKIICAGSETNMKIIEGDNNKFKAECWFENSCNNSNCNNVCDLSTSGSCPESNSNDEVIVKKDFMITTACMESQCTASGTCAKTPKPASSRDQCESSCNSNADCSSGRMIEAKP